MVENIDITARELIARKSEIIEHTRPFAELMMRYNCAMLEVKTKLDVLNKQLSLENDRNPFESISCRIKSVPSIIEKLTRKGYELTATSIEENLNDVAGIRVICSFPEDIYLLSDRLCSQDDIRLIKRKDYIKNPKPNGYRSLHLIIEIPIFLQHEKHMVKVEIQLRTIAQDFWASLEHQMRYKKNFVFTEEMANELLECATMSATLDERMEKLNICVNKDENNENQTGK